jgi:hypothetical protein
MMQLTAVFGVSNISAFISVFFHAFHWHLPIVHSPSFDPGTVSNPLLLAIFLAGAAYSTAMDDATASSSSWIIEVAEEYIFRQVSHLSIVPSPMEPANLLPTVQTLQSALIIEMLQFARDDLSTRRRIRIIRHPCLVSIVRSLGILKLKRSTTPEVCDEVTWRNLVAEEMCLRYVVYLMEAATALLWDPIVNDLVGLLPGHSLQTDSLLSVSRITPQYQYLR